MSKYRTPLRYPGGKQRLARFFAELLHANDAIGWHYVEPYAGGAGVAMELLLDNQVGRVYLNDSSRHVYACWKAMLSDPDQFCRRISRASLTVEAWKRHRDIVRHPDEHDVSDLGFSTFFLNRCNRSGVLTGGVIGGLSQHGRWRIDARFPRNVLIQRIEAVAKRRSQIRLSNLDAEEFLRHGVNAFAPETIVYCDPPYYQRSKRLYLNWYSPADHIRLARVIQRHVRRRWVVSYDGHPDILALYRKRRAFQYALQYSAIRSYSGTEVFVFSDDLEIPKTSALPYIADGLRRLLRTA